MAFMNPETLRLRALGLARGCGNVVLIGFELPSQMQLVEEGHLFQEIIDGNRYRFTLSPSGQRMLDAHEIKEARERADSNSATSRQRKKSATTARTSPDGMCGHGTSLTRRCSQCEDEQPNSPAQFPQMLGPNGGGR